MILTQALMRPVDLISAMDEPFVALDRAACVELATIVTEQLRQGCTFLIATDHEDLGALGRTLTLRDGRLDEESGTPWPACDVPTVAIDLDGRHPATRQTGSPAPGGGVRYLMPASQVAPFLEGALAGHVRVLRLNPVEPEVGP